MFSVVICTHNPDATTLGRLLDALRQQTLPSGQWELVLVDNGSAPPVRQLVTLDWHPRARIVEEATLGVLNARLCAIRETHGDLLLFLDDDTLPAPDYLAVARHMMAEHPFLGVLGGYGRAEYQGTLEPWMQAFATFYLDYTVAPDRQDEFQYAMTHTLGPWTPPTAGSIIRRSVLDRYADGVSTNSTRGLLGRRGKGKDAPSLQGGEDEDIDLTAVDMGLATGITKKMQFTHVIPPWRLDPVYLMRLLYSCNYSTATLLVSRGIKKRIAASEPSAFLQGARKAKRVLRPPTMEDECWTALAKGYQDGLAGNPFDPRYRK